MISSTSNSRVKQVAALAKKAKYRRETGLFVVEGPRMFEELPEERICQVYVTEEFLKDPAHKKSAEKAGKKEIVTEDVLKAMSDTQTPQGVLAVARQYEYSLSDLKSQKKPALFMILERIQDPGNLGTILRAGEGAGVTGVIMDQNTADIYNPKVIRSTMGSVFRVPFFYTDHLQSMLLALKQEGVCLCAAHLKGKNSYDQEDYRGDTAFLIGNEAAGLTEETAGLADLLVRIPMCGRVESLNAAVASAILMFEAARQRRSPKKLR
ncbi:MAG: RNA methyltransferase [Hungatella sp.]|jgi:TrmH family RNA methyltransferase|nr:RNA methyltransferase [Hungatella sp.]